MLCFCFNPVFLVLAIAHPSSTLSVYLYFSLAFLSYGPALVWRVPAAAGPYVGTFLRLSNRHSDCSPVPCYQFFAAWLGVSFSNASTRRMVVWIVPIFICFSFFSLCFFLLADGNTVNSLLFITSITYRVATWCSFCPMSVIVCNFQDEASNQTSSENCPAQESLS